MTATGVGVRTAPGTALPRNVTMPTVPDRKVRHHDPLRRVGEAVRGAWPMIGAASLLGAIGGAHLLAHGNVALLKRFVGFGAGGVAGVLGATGTTMGIQALG